MLTLENPNAFEEPDGGQLSGAEPEQSNREKFPELGYYEIGQRLFATDAGAGCAVYLGPLASDSRLRRWGLAFAGRGGKNSKRRAVVAVARKLAVLLHRLWVTGEVYEPLLGLPTQAA